MRKVALVFICLNPKYWPYILDVVKDCDKYFLTNRTDGHQVDTFLWTDIPEKTEDEEALKTLILNDFKAPYAGRVMPQEQVNSIIATIERDAQKAMESVKWMQTSPRVKIFPTAPAEWPAPTLMRFHLFLQQEEILKDYDYIFYMDADMRVVSSIGNDIFGEGLTAAPHPGYAIRKEYLPPYEPNIESEAYIHRLGQLYQEGDKKRFIPFYAAGGFQGGTSKEFIKAMKIMRSTIDKDFAKNYTAIWNDESHWNKFLWNYKGSITYLDPSYIYPDSLIKEYYEPLWGRSYEPKIVTLTKPFSLKTLSLEERQRLGIAGNAPQGFQCPTCGLLLQQPGYVITQVVSCNGVDKPHEVQMNKL